MSKNSTVTNVPRVTLVFCQYGTDVSHQCFCKRASTKTVLHLITLYLDDPNCYFHGAQAQTLRLTNPDGEVLDPQLSLDLVSASPAILKIYANYVAIK